MYAVVSYFNYRKDVTFTLLKTFNSFVKAVKSAHEFATDNYGEDVVIGVSNKHVNVDNEVIDGITNGDGYYRRVYTVIEFNEPEDEDE